MKKYFLAPDQKCAKTEIKRSIENNLITETRVNISEESAEKLGVTVTTEMSYLKMMADSIESENFGGE